jgi:hypothetical protein
MLLGVIADQMLWTAFAAHMPSARRSLGVHRALSCTCRMRIAMSGRTGSLVRIHGIVN